MYTSLQFAAIPSIHQHMRQCSSIHRCQHCSHSCMFNLPFRDGEFVRKTCTCCRLQGRFSMYGSLQYTASLTNVTNTRCKNCIKRTTALHHIKMTFCMERYMKNNRMHGGSVRIMQPSHKCKIMEEQCRLYLTEHSWTTDELKQVHSGIADRDRAYNGRICSHTGRLYIDTNHAASPSA